MDNLQFVYVVYIASTMKKVWNALLDPRLTSKYWQHENVSDWKPGSRWEHRQSNKSRNLDLVGEVIECAPPRRLVITWAFPADENHKEKHSTVTFELERVRGVVRLTVTHKNLEPGSDMWQGITEGWPKVLSSMKSLLESGRALPKLW